MRALDPTMAAVRYRTERSLHVRQCLVCSHQFAAPPILVLTSNDVANGLYLLAACESSANLTSQQVVNQITRHGLRRSVSASPSLVELAVCQVSKYHLPPSGSSDRRSRSMTAAHHCLPGSEGRMHIEREPRSVGPRCGMQVSHRLLSYFPQPDAHAGPRVRSRARSNSNSRLSQ